MQTSTSKGSNFIDKVTLLTGKRALAIMIEDFTITLEIQVCDFKLKNPTFFNHSSTHFRSKSVIFTRNNLKKMIILEFFF